jgi:NADPH:quinone reductase-like Zn-dependent oxidoreductase
MKAVSVDVKDEKSQLKDITIGKPKKNQVLIKVQYAPINPSDFAYITGEYPTAGEQQFP